jgi:hypothetical protein
VSQPVEAEIGPSGRIVGTITLRTIGGITAGAGHYDAGIDRISRIVGTVVIVIVRVVVVIVGIGAVVTKRAPCR